MGNTIKCSIDFTLMGILDYPELVSLHNLASTHLLKDGWRVDWYDNVPVLALGKQNELASIAPHEFYERLYNVVDLGLLYYEFLDEQKKASEIKIYIHDSILPSYQVRAYKSYSFDTTESFLQKIWQNIQATNDLIRNVVQAANLAPSIDTWTICFKSLGSDLSDDNLSVIRDAKAELLLALFGDEPIVLESASAIEDSLRVLKILGQGSEQYLIFSFDKGDELAISRLYYLMLAEGKMKHLLGVLKQAHVENIKKLRQNAAVSNARQG